MLPNIKLLFEKITALHGTNQLTRLKGKGLVVWSSLVVGIIGVTIAYVLVISKRYSNDQIITRINANCKVNQVAFPTVSICNFNIVSLKHTNGITDILKNYNQTQQEIDKFYESLPILVHFAKRAGRGNVGNFSRIMDILKRHYFTIETVMEEVHQKCEDLLLYCAFNSKTKNCKDMFRMVKTYEGFCCTFNYAALNDGRTDELSDDDDIEYYDDPSAENEKAKNIVVSSKSGRGSGLSVVFNVEPKDYANWSVTPYYGAKIVLSDPNDYPEATVYEKYAVIGDSLDIKVEPMLFQSEDDIRSVSIDKRGCAFHDEITLTHTDTYSTETCRSECRMRGYAEICGCIPYKYPKEKSSRICEFKDLKCLNNFKANNMTKDTVCQPVCYIECRDQKYTITSDVMPLLAKFYPQNIIEDYNISELAALQVYYTKSTCNCYKKMLLIDSNYFVATYGGVFSLSFGASIITLFEIIYLLSSVTLRTLWRSFNYRNKVIAKYNVVSF